MIQNELLDGLRTTGLVRPLVQPNVGPIVDHLASCQRYPGHVKVYPQEMNTSCYDMEALLSAPGFLTYALRYASLAQAYLGVEVPRLYSVNAFWAEPRGSDIHDLQTWHSDGDDSNFIAMFIYGTDVLGDDDGPHLYRQRNGEVATVYGPAGTVFIEDPRQQHMGVRPRSKSRLLMWARWGVSDPPQSYGWDQLSPVSKDKVRDYPDDPWLQDCVKLVAR